jgi:hypothetical protein
MRKPLKLSILAAALAASALLLIALAGPAAATIDPTQAPTGTHFQSGSATCSSSSGVVTCSSYQLAGVGNSDATATLSVNYTATVQCRNRGGQIVEVKSQVTGASVSADELQPKNGKLTVPALSSADAGTPSADDFEAQATCPNGNWRKETLESTIAVSSFTYTLQFDGFSGNYITLP